VKLTYDDLHAEQACNAELEQFKLLWPEGMELNEENIYRSIAAELSWSWAVSAFLSAEVFAQLNDQMSAIYQKYCTETEKEWQEYIRDWQFTNSNEERIHIVDTYHTMIAPALLRRNRAYAKIIWQACQEPGALKNLKGLRSKT